MLSKSQTRKRGALGLHVDFPVSGFRKDQHSAIISIAIFFVCGLPLGHDQDSERIRAILHL